jgi:hypothetical protein
MGPLRSHQSTHVHSEGSDGEEVPTGWAAEEDAQLKQMVRRTRTNLGPRQLTPLDDASLARRFHAHAGPPQVAREGAGDWKAKADAFSTARSEYALRHRWSRVLAKQPGSPRAPPRERAHPPERGSPKRAAPAPPVVQELSPKSTLLVR